MASYRIHARKWPQAWKGHLGNRRLYLYDQKDLPTIETSTMRVRDSNKQYYGTFEDAKLLARTSADDQHQAQRSRSGRPPLFPAARASLKGVRLEFNSD